MNRYRKGVSCERELVRILTAADVPARRLPLSGALPGILGGCDVLVLDDSGAWERWEVKRRRGFGNLTSWLRDAQVIAFRGDRDEWCVALRLADYIEDRQQAARAPAAKSEPATAAPVEEGGLA